MENKNNINLDNLSNKDVATENQHIKLENSNENMSRDTQKDTTLNNNENVSFLKNIKNQKKKPVLAVLGNEEHGISDDVRRNCDELVIIPWKGMDVGFESSNVESLNVAQAASIIFYEMCK